MKKFNYQTCLRMSETLKDEMTKICDQNAINESDFMRHAIKESILNHSRDGNNALNRLRFA
jgi:hypothetical protein